jgi:hypothetical protein
MQKQATVKEENWKRLNSGKTEASIGLFIKMLDNVKNLLKLM